MSKHLSPIDLLTDPLSDAPLTPEQKKIWEDTCSELILSRIRVNELEKRLNALEKQPDEAEVSTPLLNRPDFNREVARMLAFDERYGGSSSVVYLNLENLDVLREHFGEAMANSALKFMSDALINKVRRSDVLGRLSRDEFGILLPHCDNENAWRKGESLSTEIYDSLVKVWKGSAKPEISYGAYTFNEKEELASGLRQASANLTKLLKSD